jgi:hypothetical protein
MRNLLFFAFSEISSHAVLNGNRLLKKEMNRLTSAHPWYLYPRYLYREYL